MRRGRADRLLAAQVAAGLEREADLSRVLPFVLGTFQPFQLVEHLAAALRLLGLLAGQVAADEVFRLVDLLLLPLVRRARAFQARVAFDHVFVVGERIADELARLELDDLAADGADERAVVGHQHERAVVFGQERLQPLDRRQVQVVGRLVEQQQVRLLHQHLRQLEPAALAARQRVDRARQIGLGEADVHGQPFDARLQLVAVACW